MWRKKKKKAIGYCYSIRKARSYLPYAIRKASNNTFNKNMFDARILLCLDWVHCVMKNKTLSLIEILGGPAGRFDISVLINGRSAQKKKILDSRFKNNFLLYSQTLFSYSSLLRVPNV